MSKAPPNIIRPAQANQTPWTHSMRVVVFGASGKVGRLVVEQALEHGHQVTAFVHRSAPFSEQAALRIVHGDIHDPKTVREALTDAEVIISTLGSWHTPKKDIVASAMRTIIPAMEQGTATRLISLTGAGAYAPDDHPSLVYRAGHALFRLGAHKIIDDAETHIRLLAASQLNWTVIRSPIMTSRPVAGYALGLQAPALWQTIPRKAVARAIIDQLEGPAYSRQAPYIKAA